MEGTKGAECYFLSIGTVFSGFTACATGLFTIQDCEGLMEPITLITKVMDMEIVILFGA